MLISRRRRKKAKRFDNSQEAPATGPAAESRQVRNTQTIGGDLEIEGKVAGHTDLLVEGTVRGQIWLEGHEVTIGEEGRVTADVRAAHVVVRGRVDGSVVAEDKVEVLPTGTVLGNIRARRVVLADGATCNGQINNDRDDALEWTRPIEIDTPLAATPKPIPTATATATAKPKPNPPAVFVPRVGHDHKPKRKAKAQPHVRKQVGWTFIETKISE